MFSNLEIFIMQKIFFGGIKIAGTVNFLLRVEISISSKQFLFHLYHL